MQAATLTRGRQEIRGHAGQTDAVIGTSSFQMASVNYALNGRDQMGY